jgi:hypothetical protein
MHDDGHSNDGPDGLDDELKFTEDPGLDNDRMERASSSDSDHSGDYTQMMWQQSNLSSQYTSQSQSQASDPQFNDDYAHSNTSFQPSPQQASRTSFDSYTAPQQRQQQGNNSTISSASPVYSDFASATTASPIFRNASPFSAAWSANGGKDEFLTPAHMLDLTSLYMQQQQQQQLQQQVQQQSQQQQQQRNNFPNMSPNGQVTGIPRSMPLALNGQLGGGRGRESPSHGLNLSMRRAMRLSEGNLSSNGMVNPSSCMNGGGAQFMGAQDGTIRPGLLDCNAVSGFDMADGMGMNMGMGMGMGVGIGDVVYPDFEPLGMRIS